MSKTAKLKTKPRRHWLSTKNTDMPSQPNSFPLCSKGKELQAADMGTLEAEVWDGKATVARTTQPTGLCLQPPVACDIPTSHPPARPPGAEGCSTCGNRVLGIPCTWLQGQEPSRRLHCHAQSIHPKYLRISWIWDETFSNLKGQHAFRIPPCVCTRMRLVIE